MVQRFGGWGLGSVVCCWLGAGAIGCDLAVWGFWFFS